MKKIKIAGGVVAAVLLLVGAFLGGKHAGAAAKTPGSTEDPLITLSYLESRIGQGAAYETVVLKKGQVLLGDTGTGVVLLTGSATATGDGLVDLTEGCITRGETSMFLYHNYLVHEEKGGCAALSGCTLLVCGEYMVQ